MTIIDNQFYIIDSLSLDVLLEEMLTWWLLSSNVMVCLLLFIFFSPNSLINSIKHKHSCKILYVSTNLFVLHITISC